MLVSGREDVTVAPPVGSGKTGRDGGPTEHFPEGAVRVIELTGSAHGGSIEVRPVVISTRVFPARPSSVPEIRNFLRRFLSESPLTEVDDREVGKAIVRALLDAPATGTIQVSCRRYPDGIELDVVASVAEEVVEPVPRVRASTASTFAEWMTETLHRAGLTKEDFAGELGVSVKTVSRWVGGQTEPRLRELRRIQERFGEVRIR